MVLNMSPQRKGTRQMLQIRGVTRNRAASHVDSLVQTVSGEVAAEMYLFNNS